MYKKCGTFNENLTVMLLKDVKLMQCWVSQVTDKQTRTDIYAKIMCGFWQVAWGHFIFNLICYTYFTNLQEGMH